MPHSIRPGDVLAGRYRLVDLLSESGDGRFWRAHDRVLQRHVALHVISADDPRATGLLDAARRSATVLDQRLLRVLDAERVDGVCYVVNEWGSGTSLDIMLANNGPLTPRKAAWVVAEVADSIAVAHTHGVAHGRLVPENVLIDRAGAVRVIGFAVDAALMGLPPDRTSTDVGDLAGLLYAALTGRWPCESPSAVPAGPRAHGRLLRPRQVRAGVPRPLDDLCEEVLDLSVPGRSRERDLSSARGIHAYLTEFVGDPAGMAEAVAATNPPRGDETVVLSAVPEFPVRPEVTASSPTPASAPASAPAPAPSPPAPPAPELPTQAGLPIFDDESDDVSWLTAPGEPAPPPPPFEEPPERPLFAPDPTDGQPLRKRRSVAGAQGTSDSGEYWPWDTGRGAGSGLIPVADDDATGELEPVPGRSTFRLALAIGVGLLLLVAIVVAYNLGRGKTPLGTEPADPSSSAATSPSATTAPRALTGLTAQDLDPQGDLEEYPELAALAVDGDDSTVWQTQTYNQDFGPGGLKTGVGLVIDLGQGRTVRQVDLTMVGEPTQVSLYVTDTAPTAVRDLTPVAEAQVGASDQITLDEPATGRYVTVWLTSLPELPDGRFRAQVAEVGVLG